MQLKNVHAQLKQMNEEVFGGILSRSGRPRHQFAADYRRFFEKIDAAACQR